MTTTTPGGNFAAGATTTNDEERTMATETKKRYFDMNRFRACDAFEFVDAVRVCNFDKEMAGQRIADLSERIKRIEQRGDEVPSYLLAAYRGYEFVQTGPWDVVKLDDRDPTRD